MYPATGKANTSIGKTLFLLFALLIKSIVIIYKATTDIKINVHKSILTFAVNPRPSPIIIKKCASPSPILNNLRANSIAAVAELRQTDFFVPQYFAISSSKT